MLPVLSDMVNHPPVEDIHRAASCRKFLDYQPLDRGCSALDPPPFTWLHCVSTLELMWVAAWSSTTIFLTLANLLALFIWFLLLRLGLALETLQYPHLSILSPTVSFQFSPATPLILKIPTMFMSVPSLRLLAHLAQFWKLRFQEGRKQQNFSTNRILRTRTLIALALRSCSLVCFFDVTADGPQPLKPPIIPLISNRETNRKKPNRHTNVTLPWSQFTSPSHSAAKSTQFLTTHGIQLIKLCLILVLTLPLQTPTYSLASMSPKSRPSHVPTPSRRRDARPTRQQHSRPTASRQSAPTPKPLGQGRRMGGLSDPVAVPPPAHQQRPHRLQDQLAVYYDTPLLLSHQSSLNSDPRNPAQALLLQNIHCPRLLDERGKPRLNKIREFGANQTLDVIKRLAARLNDGAWNLDTADLMDETSAIFERLNHHTSPSESLEWGDITSSEDVFSLYLPLTAPCVVGEMHSRPTVLPVDIAMHYHADDNSALSNRARCFAVPVFHDYSDEFRSISAAQAIDHEPVWTRLLNITFLHQAYEAALPSLHDAITLLIRRHLSQDAWDSIRPALMLVTSDHHIPSQGGHLGRIPKGTGLALYLHTQPASGTQFATRRDILRLLLGSQDAKVNHTILTGLPVVISTPVEGEIDTLIPRTFFHTDITENLQHWMYFRHLPKWMTAHLLYLTLIVCFGSSTDTHVYTHMELYSNETTYRGLRESRSFIINLPAAGELARLMAPSNRTILRQGLLAIAETAQPARDPLDEVLGPLSADSFGFHSPNTPDRTGSFPLLSAARLAEADALTFNHVTFAELTQLAAMQPDVDATRALNTDAQADAQLERLTRERLLAQRGRSPMREQPPPLAPPRAQHHDNDVNHVLPHQHTTDLTTSAPPVPERRIAARSEASGASPSRKRKDTELTQESQQILAQQITRTILLHPDSSMPLTAEEQAERITELLQLVTRAVEGVLSAPVRQAISAWATQALAEPEPDFYQEDSMTNS